MTKGIYKSKLFKRNPLADSFDQLSEKYVYIRAAWAKEQMSNATLLMDLIKWRHFALMLLFIDVVIVAVLVVERWF